MKKFFLWCYHNRTARLFLGMAMLKTALSLLDAFTTYTIIKKFAEYGIDAITMEVNPVFKLIMRNYGMTGLWGGAMLVDLLYLALLNFICYLNYQYYNFSKAQWLTFFTAAGLLTIGHVAVIGNNLRILFL